MGNNLAQQQKRWTASYALPVAKVSNSRKTAKLWLSKSDIPPISSAFCRLDPRMISDFRERLEAQVKTRKSQMNLPVPKQEPISPESKGSSYSEPFGGLSQLEPMPEIRKRNFSTVFEDDQDENPSKTMKIREKANIASRLSQLKHNYDELYVAKTLAEFAVVKKPAKHLGPAISFEDIKQKSQPVWRIPMNEVNDTTPQPNKFLFGRSILQPALTLFSFSTISILVSALWNDSSCTFENYISFLSFLRSCDTSDWGLIPDGFSYRSQTDLESENTKNSAEVFKQQFENLQEYPSAAQVTVD